MDSVGQGWHRTGANAMRAVDHPMSKPQARCTIKFALFADVAPWPKIEMLGGPLQVIARHIAFAH